MVYFQLAGHTEQNEAVGEKCPVTTHFFELILRQFPEKFIVYMDQQSAQDKQRTQTSSKIIFCVCFCLFIKHDHL